MIQLTSRERRAVIILIVVLGGGAFMQWLVPHQVKSDQYNYSMQDSLFKALSADTIVSSESNQEIFKKPRKSTGKKTVSKISLAEKSININSAIKSELEKLPGIGPKTAQGIIDYREQNGPFRELEQLKKVKRIGVKTLQKISPFIYIQVDSTKK